MSTWIDWIESDRVRTKLFDEVWILRSVVVFQTTCKMYTLEQKLKISGMKQRHLQKYAVGSFNIRRGYKFMSKYAVQVSSMEDYAAFENVKTLDNVNKRETFR